MERLSLAFKKSKQHPDATLKNHQVQDINKPIAKISGIDIYGNYTGEYFSHTLLAVKLNLLRCQ